MIKWLTSWRKSFIYPEALRECRVAILSLDTMERSVKNKFSQNIDLLLFSLINICNEFLVNDKRGYAFRHWNSTTKLSCFLWKDQSLALRHFWLKLMKACVPRFILVWTSGSGVPAPSQRI